VTVCLVSWLVPGAGHLLLKRRHKGVIFLVALPAMFAVGLVLDGRLFPFEFSQPLVGLAALANLGMGAPYFIASFLGLGKGVVTAASYEYANAFLIVAGLLNMLVVLDAYDVRLKRK
jgi:ABC-type microcin C transport system permease subunit YejE